MNADNYNDRYTVATISGGDFTSVSMLLTFGPDSADGAEMCASVTANSDNLVELEEDFTVILSLVTLGASLSVGNAATIVAVADSDGIWSYFFVSNAV